jgi:hypothetical protein
MINKKKKDKFMSIYVVDHEDDGSVHTFDMLPSDTVYNLINQIHIKLDIPRHEIILRLRRMGRRLRYDEILSDMNILDLYPLSVHQTSDDDLTSELRRLQAHISQVQHDQDRDESLRVLRAYLQQGRGRGRGDYDYDDGGGGAAPLPPNRVDQLLHQLEKRNRKWRQLLTSEENQLLKKHQDSVTLEPYRDPVTIPQSGMTYERSVLRDMIDRGKPICPLTKKPLKQTIGMIETMQPSFHVKNGTVQALQRILQRMPSEIPTPSQQALHNIDATQRAPFQVFLRKQGLSLNSSQQQLQRAWVRYKRIKAMSLKKK